MTDRELNIALREMARSHGLCDEWYSLWSDDSTIDECLDRYVRGFDFAVEKDYPSLSFIREYFDRETLHRHNIYLDENVDISADRGHYVFLGSCKAKVKVSGLKVVAVYVRHDSIVDVSATLGAKVFASYYDRSVGECTSDKYSFAKKYDRTSKR